MSTFAAKAQYYYEWSVGGSLGLGPAEDVDGFALALGMTIDFNKVIRNTKWRWGVEAGGFALGTLVGINNNEEDVYIRPDFQYIGGVADYSLHSKGIIDLFARAGIAPAHQRDLYLHHEEHKLSVLGIAGIGSDVGFNSFLITFYLSHRGIPTFLFSYGMHFGKKTNK